MDGIVRGNAKRVLAIGASASTSALQPEEALAPDGMLILMESDPARAGQARSRFSSSGLQGRATVIAGDPRRMLHKLAGPFDVIFCGDASASERDVLAKLLTPDGVLITNDDK
jgi:predicted O-methyltransferase YrrM